MYPRVFPYGRSLSPVPESSEYPDSVVIPDGSPCISVKALTDYLQLDIEEETEMLNNLIASAQDNCETFLDVCSTKREAKAQYLRPGNELILPRGPHKVLSIEVDGEALGPNDYDINGLEFLTVLPYVHGKTTVTFEVGCAVTPGAFIMAVIEEATFRYKNRNDPEVMAAETKSGLSLNTYNALSIMGRDKFIS